MKKSVKTLISILLVAAMLIGTLAACGKSNKEETTAITATAVKYTKSGQYTTTVSSKKVDLSGINADNVEVRYLDLTADSAAAKAESTEVATEEATTEATEEPKLEDVYTLFAKVESVKATDKKSCEITFTDDRAAELKTGNYIILFKSIEGDDNTANVSVEFPEITLTPDVDNVVSDATQAKVTLAIDGSTFEDGISEKDIYLDNAFSDMKIESVASSDKNLTVQLKGSPVRNAAGAYQWGSINVKPSGIKDGYADVTSKIDVKLAAVNIDASTLRYENGKINADLKVYGIVDINTLTKDNIKIDGAAVEAAEKADDNTVKLTLSADGIKSVNDFADLFGKKAMTIGDYETTVSVSQASFYPVFDYVEADGDNLKLTLKLYANNGTFDKNIKAEAISFADDFKDSKAESIKVDSDTVATLILSAPANGQTTETMDLDGTVTLAAGALTNAWGDKTSKEASYSRNYSGESLGRDAGASGVSLNADTLLEIQKYTRGLNTTFGKICYYGQMAGSVYSIAMSILEATGIVESDHAKVMKELAEINKKLDAVLDSIEDVRMDLIELEDNQYRTMLIGYQENLEYLENKLDDVNNVFVRARKDMAKENEKYADIDWDNLTDREAAEYNHALYTFIEKKIKEDPSNSNYKDYEDDSKKLKEAFETVASSTRRGGDNNPIRIYDELCSVRYMFDSQAFDIRLSQRLEAETLMTKAVAALSVRYDAVNDDDNANFTGVIEKYKASLAELDKLNENVLSAKDVQAHLGEDKYSPYCYVLGSKVKLISVAENFGLLYFGPLVDPKVDVSKYTAVMDMLPTRTWTSHELTVFKSRIHGTLKNEFESAGLPANYPLAIKSDNNVKNMKDLSETTSNGKYISERSYDAVFSVIPQDSNTEVERSLSIIDKSYYSVSPYHLGIISSRSANGKDDYYTFEMIN
ncbi:MAG: hypothetical protein IKS39_02680 [Clostridia bacterium]|nr:hypothetical protein [Clostridia bacterium]